MTANIHRDSKRRPEPFTAKDFLPEWGKPPEPEPDEDGMAPAKIRALIGDIMFHQERAQRMAGKTFRKPKNGIGS